MISHLFLRYTYLLYVTRSLQYKEYETIKDHPFHELPVALQSELCDSETSSFVEKELLFCEQNHMRILEYQDPCYPKKIRSHKNMPPCLYIHGLAEVLSMEGIAMVGSRKASTYGLKQAFCFAGDIAKQGLTVISGLAYGIDTKAHEGCLDNQGYTVAVIGNGIDIVYPKSNASLHQRIIKNGCIVSEFPLSFPPHKYHFPVRNRIISALSDKVVVVEASEKSGALITVDYALDQGKEVYAIPGNIDSPTSKGTNQLIRNGAILLDSFSVLFPDQPALFHSQLSVSPSGTEMLNTIETAILKLIQSNEMDLDEIVSLIQEDTSKVLQALSVLELKGFISKIQGKYIGWKRET